MYCCCSSLLGWGWLSGCWLLAAGRGGPLPPFWLAAWLGGLLGVDLGLVRYACTMLDFYQ